MMAVEVSCVMCFGVVIVLLQTPLPGVARKELRRNALNVRVKARNAYIG